MVLVYRFLAAFLKIALLFFIIAFERAIGFPVFFLTLTIAFMLMDRSVSRYIMFVAAAFMLAVFYQLAFVITFFILAAFYLGFVTGQRVLESNVQRFLVLLLMSVTIIAYASQIQLHFWIILHLLVSLLFALLFLLKFLFVRYGFLGMKAQGQSFFR